MLPKATVPLTNYPGIHLNAVIVTPVTYVVTNCVPSLLLKDSGE